MDRGINPPLAQGARNLGYGLAELNALSGRSDILILVAFSGGGKRSAAFAHGALRGMRDVPVDLLEGHACDDVQGLLVHVSLADVSDPTLRARLRLIPTSLTLSKEEVDQLVSAGETVIRGNGRIAAFLSGGPATAGRGP